MRLIVITLVSVLGYSLADILKVKCGDELCEKPSNLAVTTLRYVPDKPYKLQIFSLNSEVEIFGITDDLYYAKYGRNFGFLPKNHLREKNRGNFQHSVEINFDNIQLNTELKEKNYLSEVLKSSHSSTQNANETENSSIKVEQKIENDNQIPQQQQQQQQNIEDKEKEVKVESPKLEEERPKEYIPIGTEPKIPSPQPEASKAKTDDTVELKNDEKPKQDDSLKIDEKIPVEVNQVNETKSEEKIPQEVQHENNDSGIEDEEDDEESEIDDEEEEDEEDENESDVVDSKEEKNETITTEVPKAATDPVKVENSEAVELNENASKETEEVKIEKPANVENTVQEVPKDDVTEKPAELIQNEQDFAKNETEPANVEQVQESEKSIESPEILTEQPPEIKETVPEKPLEIPEVIEPVPEKPKDPVPAPVFEEVNEIEKVPETTTEKFEELPPPPIIEETTQPYQPAPTELPEVKQETEVPPLPQEKREMKIDQDMLLKRFNEKLGHKSLEGVGSVEQVNKHHSHSHDHSHSHSHSHEHQSHSHENTDSHDHLHSHDIKTDQSKEEVVENEQDKKPGFFSGLVKKIFGDEHENHQHSHDANENHEAKLTTPEMTDEGFCEKIDSENCPKSLRTETKPEMQQQYINSNSIEDYLKMMLSEAVEMMDVIVTMGLVALTVLIFIFGHYCISKASKEGELIKKMNVLERELMASAKENGSLKVEVEVSKQQLKSIQDNSFGSNDMVIALKQDLEMSEREKEELLEKVAALEKELEAAAEDGLELNKMVSELLNNQSGSDSIISSVEDLQKQLNEQQETIVTMNEALAAKSRENTELQIQLSEINGKFGGEFEKFQQQIDAIILERSNLQIELENLKRESDLQINQIIEERNSEVTRLNNELTSYAGKYDENKKLLIAAESKVQALNDCIDTIKKTKGGDYKNLLDVADLKADLLAVTKEKSTIQEQLQSERDSRKLLEERVKTVSAEMSNLKKEFSVAEKEKVDALTRLDVLSNYFKEKEMQLQQELSVKEARWMKQQGETTSTVEKVQALNAEIQTLKSQNDELKAEFEAQVISYKAKLTNVEAQSHSAWLAAKQAERKLEESRMEAANLRRRLTSIAENPTASAELLNGVPNDSINSIPSPMRVESPNNISLPPPPLMMPPFLPGAPPFLPPPFMPGEMPMVPGIPPLGRLMSPPPKRFTPTMRDDRDRYSPRGRYSPDSRYDDYTPFETETDISPPRSPVPQQRRGYSSPSDRNKKSKGHNSEQPTRRK